MVAPFMCSGWSACQALPSNVKAKPYRAQILLHAQNGDLKLPKLLEYIYGVKIRNHCDVKVRDSSSLVSKLRECWTWNVS
jgi:hypothetical protein